MEREISRESLKALLSNSRRIWQLVWGSMPWLSVGIVVMVFFGTVAGYGRQAAQAILVNQLVNIGRGQSAPLLVLAITFFVVMFIVPQIFFWVRSFLAQLFRHKLEEYVDFLFFEKRGQLDVAQWENPKKNDTFTIVSENEYRLFNSADRWFNIFGEVITFGIATVIMAAYKWWTLPILIVATLPELWVAVKYGNRVWGIMQSRSETKRRYTSFVDHFYELPQMVELRLFQNVDYFLGNIRTLYRSFQEEEKKNEKKRFWYGLGAFLTVSAGIATIALVFIGAVVHGQMTLGAFLFVIGSAISFRSALSSMFQTLGQQYGDSHFISEIFRFLDMHPELPQSSKPIALIRSETPEIVFDNVTFYYPESVEPSLKNISFTVHRGDKVAIVGLNGSGKTTLVKLLCRFYDPTEGRILIGGYDLREIDLKSWYDKLGVLFQEYSRYAMSVEELISLGKTSVTRSDERVHWAGEVSGADSFIRTWDDGYHQMLGKKFSGGVEPSIGRWQRLALSRVYYRKAQVVVLDEPTASIDPQGEAEIFEQFGKLSNDQSVILISHRLSTVRRISSNILVLDDGRLSEMGSHDELVHIPNGIYAKLFASQAKWYE